MSPTIQTLIIGFATLSTLIGAGRLMGGASGMARAIKVFFPTWLIYTVWHLSVGMKHGYTFTAELPFLLLNFGVPALIAWMVWQKWVR